MADQLPRLGKRELICLLLFTCNYVVSVWRGFLFLLVLGMGCVIKLWHSLGLPYNYFLTNRNPFINKENLMLLMHSFAILYTLIPGHFEKNMLSI